MKLYRIPFATDQDVWQVVIMDQKTENIPFLGDLMTHKKSGNAGVVTRANSSASGWVNEITIELKSGVTETGSPAAFQDATPEERQKFING